MDTSIGTEKSKNIYRGTYKKRSPYHEDRSCARDYSREYLEVSQTAVFDAERDYPKTIITVLLPYLIAAWAAARRAMGTRKGEQDT